MNNSIVYVQYFFSPAPLMFKRVFVAMPLIGRLAGVGTLDGTGKGWGLIIKLSKLLI